MQAVDILRDESYELALLVEGLNEVVTDVRLGGFVGLVSF
jgi:hypothetical protein